MDDWEELEKLLDELKNLTRALPMYAPDDYPSVHNMLVHDIETVNGKLKEIRCRLRAEWEAEFRDS